LLHQAAAPQALRLDRGRKQHAGSTHSHGLTNAADFGPQLATISLLMLGSGAWSAWVCMWCTLISLLKRLCCQCSGCLKLDTLTNLQTCADSEGGPTNRCCLQAAARSGLTFHTNAEDGESHSCRKGGLAGRHLRQDHLPG
jgi:hypothetical protein